MNRRLTVNTAHLDEAAKQAIKNLVAHRNSNPILDPVTETKDGSKKGTLVYTGNHNSIYALAQELTRELGTNAIFSITPDDSEPMDSRQPIPQKVTLFGEPNHAAHE